MAIVFNPFTGNFDFSGGDATASLLNLKGQVATVGALPSSGNTIGDVWQVTADLTFRVWDGAAWENLGTFQGPAGQNLELQKTATHIQWRVVGGTWANLVALSEITGPQGGGGGGAPAPGYATFASGALIAPVNYSGAVTSSNAVANTVCYHPIYIPATQVFTQILCRTAGTYAGTTDLLLGIYSHDATNNRPLSKVYDSGSLQITASGGANYGPGTISQSLSPGFYWLAFLATSIGTTPAFLGVAVNNRGVGFPWFTEVTTAGAVVTCLTQSGQSTLPATANAVQGSAVARPVVFLGV